MPFNRLRGRGREKEGALRIPRRELGVCLCQRLSALCRHDPDNVLPRGLELMAPSAERRATNLCFRSAAASATSRQLILTLLCPPSSFPSDHMTLRYPSSTAPAALPTSFLPMSSPSPSHFRALPLPSSASDSMLLTPSSFLSPSFARSILVAFYCLPSSS